MLIATSLASVMILTFGLVTYFAKVKKNQTPENPVALKVAMGSSALLAIISIGALMLSPHSQVSAGIVVLSALFVLPTTIMFSYALASVKTPVGELAVKVGDSLPAFESMGFNSDSLAGKRTLLKFYRGAWCPYCSAELVMFEQMKPRLKEYGIEVVAVSNDTSAQQQEHLARDQITHTLVSDPELNVIRQFGVEHHKALGASSSDTINFFGVSLPLSWKMKFKPMAIPTSLLVTESGMIAWIDQSEDLRMRANEDMVMDAVQSNFDKA